MANARIQPDTEPSIPCGLAKPLAPEDIRIGDYVATLYVTHECASFLWDMSAGMLPIDEPVRLRFVPDRGGVPLKVKAVCLPFVLVKHPAGGKRTLDTRRHHLARLDSHYAQQAWKLEKKDLQSRDCR